MLRNMHENIDDKLKMQEQELQEPRQYFTGENKKETFQSSEKENKTSCNLDNKQNNGMMYKRFGKIKRERISDNPGIDA